jgi:hypothetical protein
VAIFWAFHRLHVYQVRQRSLKMGNPGGVPIRMSLINEGRSLAHAVGADVSVGFRAEMAIALPKGSLAKE